MTEKQILTWFTSLPEYKSYAEAIGDYNKDLAFNASGSTAVTGTLRLSKIPRIQP